MLVRRRSLHAAVYFRLHIGADKDVEWVIFPQNNIRVPSDDDAVLAQCGNVFNDFLLLDQQKLYPPRLNIGCGGDRAAIGHGELLPAVVAQLMLDISRVEAALLCDRSDYLAVIVIKAQNVRNALAELTTAAAEFTADGYYSHNRPPFLFNTFIILILSF